MTLRFGISAEHPDTLTSIEVATAYGEMIATAELGPIVGFRVSDSPGDGPVPGGLSDLVSTLRTKGDRAHSFMLVTAGAFSVQVVRGTGGEPTWSVSERGHDGAWLSRAVRFAEALARHPLPHGYVVVGRQDARLDFVPSPPIARHNHAVETDEAAVAAAFEDPALFWRQWEQVHKIGEKRLCIRALDAVELPNWLARTFEGTMALARNARPGLTKYQAPTRWDTRLRAFWEPGSFGEEKAGMPALSLTAYDAATKTATYSGFIDKSDEHGHVLAKELADLYTIYMDDADDQGRPVAAVHVTFLEEWMAHQERRPLRDVHARVFYLDKDGTAVEVTD